MDTSRTFPSPMIPLSQCFDIDQTVDSITICGSLISIWTSFEKEDQQSFRKFYFTGISPVLLYCTHRFRVLGAAIQKIFCEAGEELTSDSEAIFSLQNKLSSSTQLNSWDMISDLSHTWVNSWTKTP
ncbi:hypothetical protein Pint_06150 [Pistacia integerrima]|uniref:Uncharacterized protein n=1 Tax=Pistacia integerrima TaxID=434235 RepID=A0ACC0Z3V4_9ROSI|nr:hypothetical protein Pint_06150 [Pistacia integerrima]